VGVRLEAWEASDLPLLRRLLGDAETMRHLGGPETEARIAERNARYAQPGSRMFRVVDDETGAAVGSVGYWEREWRGGQVWETGWFVLPAFQGRGIASAATRLVVERARAEGTHRFLHAFPSVENPPSNAICRKVGFELVEECEFEYPKGSWMRCNDWRLDLLADA
jgi:RimJ/RimL family protein N-acetyltransferase